jgi:hypothetical protein
MKQFVMAPAVFLAAVFVVAGAETQTIEQESWTMMAFEFGNMLEFSKDSEPEYFGAPGFNMSVYGFNDRKPVGFFVHYGLLFPVVSTLEHIRDYDMQVDMLVGPVLRFPPRGNLTLYCGAGFDLVVTSGSHSEGDIWYSRSAFDLGIGADIGLKYDITDAVHIQGGMVVSYMFFNNTSSSSRETTGRITTITSISDDNIEGYGQFGAKPYIGIGFSSYSVTTSRYGKPE